MSEAQNKDRPRLGLHYSIGGRPTRPGRETQSVQAVLRQIYMVLRGRELRHSHELIFGVDVNPIREGDMTT